MIVGFNGKVARDIWESNSSKTLPREFWLRAKALLSIMHSTRTLEDLRIRGEPPNIRLHKLSRDRKGYWSITIKVPWCITFRYSNGEFSEVKIENYHRG
jgi:plasmid maintenance system killer protein